MIVWVIAGAAVLITLLPYSASAQLATSASYQEFQNGNYSAAAALARRAIAESPTNVEERIVLGWTLLATANYQAALEVGREALGLRANDPRIFAIIGESEYFLDNWLEALPILERYIATAPNGVAVGRVYSLMGEIFIRFREYHHADIAYAAATHHDSTIAQWWYRRGFVLEQLRRPEEALNAYTQAITLEPSLTEAQNAIQRLQ